MSVGEKEMKEREMGSDDKKAIVDTQKKERFLFEV